MMEYKNKGALIGTGTTNVLSATTNQKLLVKTIHCTNSYSADTSVNLQWNDKDASATYDIANGVTVPVSSSFQALDGTFTLEPLDSIQASAGHASGVTVTFSYMQITDSEG